MFNPHIYSFATNMPLFNYLIFKCLCDNDGFVRTVFSQLATGSTIFSGGQTDRMPLTDYPAGRRSEEKGE